MPRNRCKVHETSSCTITDELWNYVLEKNEEMNMRRDKDEGGKWFGT